MNYVCPTKSVVLRMGDRYFWPEVEQWLMARHGVGLPKFEAGSKGETFNEWREKARGVRRSSVPGLIYRRRQRGWALSWSPRSDLMTRGYQGKTVILWPGSAKPPQQSESTRQEWETISA